MVHVKLAETPCEVEDKINTHAFGVRVASLVRKINFPGREKIVLCFEKNWLGYQMKMLVEVTDTKDGTVTALNHSVSLTENMSDDDIVKEIFIMLGQYVIHEFAETFRFDGKILFDPHEGTRNEKMFQAVREMVKPIPPPVAGDGTFTYLVTHGETTAVPSQNEALVPLEKPKKKTHPFAQFFKTDTWHWSRRKGA